MRKSLFPILNPRQLTTADKPLPLYQEIAWDFEKGQPIFKDGATITITGKEAIKVWIWKAILTARKRFSIYTWNYGSELETLIGQNYTPVLKRAEAVRYIKEAIQINPYITSINQLKVEFSGGDLKMSGEVITIYGEVTIDATYEI